MMTEPPHLATIRRCYDAWNRADIELMRSLFTADVIHYFMDCRRFEVL